ncbi:endoplasmic reticulum-based factor for assembly of V-ATPase-domain-containing protein [Lipomyces tetrasporus]|uniref:Endoplasmic reticulum-based factor for assembly of V-ATPase-domain-containing protein n=1 Tax=Lipomyces tetrasporus TaxID=54092 RepID=A0AAD7QWV1_9ASCO|nr:endoplasmic reticulum-based factor for assembly of V-ATPase-domain-containing protein [Lipomyces tetrasporus]KAJ8103002.1 endoplasmic reticulum-based factor for assembly of V-ATPase-domain-containing protein [Lipomyces tetrasporus]
MVKLTKTELISEAVVLFNEKISPDESNAKPISTESLFVTHNTLGKLALALKCDKYTFSKLLAGTQIYIPPKPEKKADPEFDARMKRLRVRLQEQEYQEMIASAVPELSSSFLEPFEKKEIKQQISVIINIMFSVVSVAFAVWVWGGSSLNTGKRLLLSMFAGVVVLIAEVALYTGYIQRIDDARKKEKWKKEVKEVINTVEFVPSTRQVLEKKERAV